MVRGVSFLRISSICTIRDASSTDGQHILRRDAVRCVIYLFFDNPTVRYGALFVFYGAIRCGFFCSLESYGAVQLC